MRETEPPPAPTEAALSPPAGELVVSYEALAARFKKLCHDPNAKGGVEEDNILAQLIARAAEKTVTTPPPKVAEYYNGSNTALHGREIVAVRSSGSRTATGKEGKSTFR